MFEISGPSVITLANMRFSGEDRVNLVKLLPNLIVVTPKTFFIAN